MLRKGRVESGKTVRRFNVNQGMILMIHGSLTLPPPAATLLSRPDQIRFRSTGYSERIKRLHRNIPLPLSFITSHLTLFQTKPIVLRTKWLISRSRATIQYPALVLSNFPRPIIQSRQERVPLLPPFPPSALCHPEIVGNPVTIGIEAYKGEGSAGRDRY